MMNNLEKKLANFKENNPKIYMAVQLGLLLLLSTLFLLIFSLWTSPFYKNWYGCDASFFTMAGRGIATKGWVPYKDFFDLKGPYFFFLEALSQFVCKGRTGAYITQIFALFFALLFMIKSCRLFISTRKTGFIVALFLTFYASTLWGGNTLEEYALPLNLIAIYFILRDLKNNDFTGSISPLSSLITGLCFCFILFGKMTVASPIAGIVLGLTVFCIKNKRIKELLVFLIYSFLGILLAATPIFIYFYAKDMLTEMLYAVFVFAFKRSTDFGPPFSIRWELKISGCYFAIIYVICQIRLKRKMSGDNLASVVNTTSSSTIAPIDNTTSGDNKIINDSMTLNESESANDDLHTQRNSFMLTTIFITALITAILLHFGDPFIYYFTTVYPILMLTLISMFLIYDPFTLFKGWRLDLPMIAFLIFVSYYAGHTANQLNTVIYDRGNTYYQDYVEKALEMASFIPASDRDSVYSYNMDMQWFECNNILPCYSYTINLQFFVALDERIKENILRKLENDPPKWIVCGEDVQGYIPEIGEIILSKYTSVYENQYGSLYLLD